MRTSTAKARAGPSWRAARQRLGAGGLYRVQPVGRDRGVHAHHLPVAVGIARQTSPDPLEGGRQRPVLERRTVPERAGLSRQHGQVVPKVVDHLVAAETTGMVAHHLARLPDHDAIDIGVHLDRPALACAWTEYLL